MLSRILCIVATAALITVTVSGAALADEGLPAKIVAKELYKTGKRVTIVRMLQPELIPGIYKVALEKAAKIQKYYEAMAASPDEGMLAKSASHAINHHSAKAAHAAAITACNAKKKDASKDCVIVAEFLPKGYKGSKAFSLSMNATEIFAKAYKRARKNKAFAASASSGHWGEAVKQGSLEEARLAALAACEAKTKAKDCKIISEN